MILIVAHIIVFVCFSLLYTTVFTCYSVCMYITVMYYYILLLLFCGTLCEFGSGNHTYGPSVPWTEGHGLVRDDCHVLCMVRILSNWSLLLW